jgi:DNA-binding MarR family transcriptional regulator
MAPTPISQNEQLTLFGLTRYPTYNDRQLSETLNIKMSTVTAIKNRLKRQGLFQSVRVPYMYPLGCEIVSVCYARLNPLIPHQTMVKTMSKVLGELPECVWAVTDPSNLLAVTVSKNYTDIKMCVEKAFNQFIENDYLEHDTFEMTHYPFGQSAFFRYFDYAPLIQDAFALDRKEVGKPIQVGTEKVDVRHLTRIERKALMGLVRFPDLLDNSVAKKIGVTRQSVTKMKKRFETEGLLSTIKIPNVQALEFDILLYIRPRFNSFPANKKKDWQKSVLKAYDMSRWVFIASTDLEAGLVVMGKDYKTIQNNIATAVATYKKMGFLREYPDIKFMSLQDIIVLKNHEYAPLLEKIFAETD